MIEEPALVKNLVASLISKRAPSLAKLRGIRNLVNRLISHIRPDTARRFKTNLNPLEDAVLVSASNRLIVSGLIYTDTLNLFNVSSPTLTSFPLDGIRRMVDGD
jgi:hypothetical protein